MQFYYDSIIKAVISQSSCGAFSIDSCMLCHRENIMPKDELATTLRENHAVNKKTTTDERNYAKRHVQFKEKY